MLAHTHAHTRTHILAQTHTQGGGTSHTGPLTPAVTLRTWPAVEEGLGTSGGAGVEGGGDASGEKGEGAEDGGGAGSFMGAGDGSGDGVDEETMGEGGVGRGSNRGVAVVAAAQWWDGLLRER